MGYWIQKIKLKKGTLHRQLGIPQERKIPTKILRGIRKTPVGNKFRGVRVTTILKRRVNLAYNLRRLR